MRDRLVIGTRKSALALWQSHAIKKALEDLFPGLVVELQHIVTLGDKTQDSQIAIPAIGGKGLFTAELEDALKAKEIDLAVHSLKDLPTTMAPDFTLGAIPSRGPVEDVMISRGAKPLARLSEGARVGTSSLRRSSQILRLRPDLRVVHIRGNVDTRLRKLRADGGDYDAIILARAGVERLGLGSEVTEIFSSEQMLPAPGQGALAIECRSSDSELLSMLSKLHDPLTAVTVGAERAFLAALEAGCNTPVGALATIEQRSGKKYVHFHGRCLSNDGSRVIETVGECAVGEEARLGQQMAEESHARGFAEL